MAVASNLVAAATASSQGYLIEVQDVTKHFPTGGGGLSALLLGSSRTVRAVDGVSFAIRRGGSLGLVGESGSGKTTTGRLLLKLLEPTQGRIIFDGVDLRSLDREGLRAFRRRAQLVFQNPYEALNPRFTILRSVMEPLIIHGIGDHNERRERALEVLEEVGLRPAERYANRFPHELSGGQLQRVVLARALVLRPDFLVADEPVSMLDVSIRADILNLMRKVAQEYELTTVYISHDLSLIRYTCERTAVMYLGKIMEIGPTEEIINNPRHPYTQALISAVPDPDMTSQRERLEISEAIYSAVNLPRGCRFQDRCPYATSRCVDAEPPLLPVGSEHEAACWLYEEDWKAEE